LASGDGRREPPTAEPMTARVSRSGPKSSTLSIERISASRRRARFTRLLMVRAFAISLCRNVDRADDLVQEALLRGWAHLDSFEPGTNMSAWLFTILRNVFRSEYRRRWREVEDADGFYSESLTSLPGQTSHLEMDEFRKALMLLPPDQRESLVLVAQ
jgi:RNA polymerase sigma-70 factor (ECF subfamily)